MTMARHGGYIMEIHEIMPLKRAKPKLRHIYRSYKANISRTSK